MINDAGEMFSQTNKSIHLFTSLTLLSFHCTTEPVALGVIPKVSAIGLKLYKKLAGHGHNL